MIEITNVDVSGWDTAIRGMRNPMNSWDHSDSTFGPGTVMLGEDDLSLGKRLVQAGTDHGKFARFIVAYCDINAPLYWWKEFDTYRAGVEKNSTSTMHKIHSKQLTMSDFSIEHLGMGALDAMRYLIMSINLAREDYLKTGDKNDWYQMIQLLPSSYNQKRSVMMSYAALRNMYHARRTHKLDEWHAFCEWVETLPYAKEFIIGDDV